MNQSSKVQMPWGGGGGGGKREEREEEEKDAKASS